MLAIATQVVMRTRWKDEMTLAIAIRMMMRNKDERATRMRWQW